MLKPARRGRSRLVAITSLALFIGLVPAGAASAAGTFVDDDGSVHEGSIEAVAAAGITTGCNPPANNRFCPDEPVTRGQMAAFLVRALDLVDRGRIDFVDDDDSVFEDDIERLATAAITLGCNPPDNDRFCPDENVTRGQMAAFLVRAFNYDAVDAGIGFVDDEDSPFQAEIERLATAGVTRGCNPPTNDMFCPGEAVTRGQMATFLTRALDLDPILPASDCTEVIGFSQTNQWYSGGETRVYSPFEDLVGDDEWQLRWFEGAEARIIADEAWPGWAADPVSACTSGPPDRVILTVTGARGTDVAAWERDIRDAIARIRTEVPTATSIVLQPVVGGPDDQDCINGGTQVRADLQHPYIWEAILQVSSESSDVTTGMKPIVDSCDDFRDGRGHLTEEAIPRIGAKIGDYYG